MRLIAVLIIAVTIGFAFASCKSSSGSPTFCDTVCLKDTFKFTKDNHPLRPYVYISVKDCKPDSLIWSYAGMGVNRKLDFTDLTGIPVHLNKDFIRCVINDTSYAWLLFNDCNGGRGYYFKIPFDKTKNLGRSNRAINGFDPKFSVSGSLMSYIDPGNIFVEDMTTGKTAMMTFGKDIEPDYANIHNSIDSVSITPARIWAKVKINNEWKEKEKKIELK
jgi:hypothetical protein